MTIGLYYHLPKVEQIDRGQLDMRLKSVEQSRKAWK